MKLGLQLTLEGMIRTLRMKALELGEDYDDMRRNAEERNEAALALLAAETRRLVPEVGDESGR